jgi:transcriptional regulator with XRE-family HTH domain
MPLLVRALALTQEEFAARYRIPLGTLRDWEQGRSEPDQPAQAYLTVIARDPKGVGRALHPARRQFAGAAETWEIACDLLRRSARVPDKKVHYGDRRPLRTGSAPATVIGQDQR